MYCAHFISPSMFYYYQLGPYVSTFMKIFSPKLLSLLWKINCNACQQSFLSAYPFQVRRFYFKETPGPSRSGIVFLSSRKGLPGDSVVKYLLANAKDEKTWVRSLGQEDPLEKEMATCSSILAWEILWSGGPGRLQPMGSQRVRHKWGTHVPKW